MPAVVPRPNILLLMVDQLAASWLPPYGHDVVQAPQIAALAAEGVVFDCAYCASPLCAPSRASLLTGRLPSRTGVYDNAAELRASAPTVTHRLRAAGYLTCLSGKMHFVGPDQLHGFEQRLTTDIYPADLDWTPDWRLPPTERLPWYHTMESVLRPGVCAASMQMDYDDEVAHRAVRKLRDLARGGREQPFFLTVSFTHPHDPWELRPGYWERYEPGRDRPARRRPDPARAGRPAQPAAARHGRHRRRRAHRRAGPRRAPRLLRGDQLRRRAHRRGARRARRVRPERRHDRAVHGRPRRDAGRARALVQDGVLRAGGARSADRLRAGPTRRAARGRAGVAARRRADAARPVRARGRRRGSTGRSLAPALAGERARRRRRRGGVSRGGRHVAGGDAAPRAPSSTSGATTTRSSSTTSNPTRTSWPTWPASSPRCARSCGQRSAAAGTCPPCALRSCAARRSAGWSSPGSTAGRPASWSFAPAGGHRAPAWQG